MLTHLPANPYQPQKFHANKGPLQPQELVPDHALRSFCIVKPEHQCGVISTDDQATLSMYLGDICGELLAFRKLAALGDL